MQEQSPFQVYNASAGSGKTFTLVKEYLKIVLGDTDRFRFQHILAVTFTNKAAAEMKDRVLKALNSYAQGKSNDMLKPICSELGLTNEIIFERSGHILNAILQHYSGFTITTIDSFTHRLIKNFAYDLGLPMAYDVEMDVDSLLSEAVDLVISKIGRDNELTSLLLAYSLQKSEDDRSWDIAHVLKDFSKILLNENHDTHLKALEKVTIEDFRSLKQQLQQENVSIEKEFSKLGRKGKELIDEMDVGAGDFSGGGDLPRHFNKLLDLRKLGAHDLKFEGRLNKAVENEKLTSGKCTPAAREQIENKAEQLIGLYDASKQLYGNHFPTYARNKLVIEALIPLAVLHYIHQGLSEIKQENGVMLNAEFNKIINETIKDEPAPFIYERIGEKFRYYFVDEMQDTSVLQWQNLIPLVEHALISENELGQQGRLLLVGDAKQSIYRWRGGKASQFIALSKSTDKMGHPGNPFYLQKQINHLGTNFRSTQKVVEFNNNFFQHSARHLQHEDYRNLFEHSSKQNLHNKKSGYVQLRFLDNDDDEAKKEIRYSQAVLETITALDPAFERNEVCVLVRTKKQGMAVADHLSRNNIEIISSETLVIGRNVKVRFIIDLLRVIQNPDSDQFRLPVLYFLYDHLSERESIHTFIKSLIHSESEEFFNNLEQYGYDFNYEKFIQLSLYEGVNYIIEAFELSQKSDANLQYFLDIIFEYQEKKRASIDAFLEYWDLKKETFSVIAPEAPNAVRIMTIHKAKGLEFPVVIFPFDLPIYKQHKPKIWLEPLPFEPIRTALVAYNPFLELTGETGKQIYDERQHELEFDNFNLLYVTFTRASEQLYIIGEKKAPPKRGEKIKSSSGLFIDYLKEAGHWKDGQQVYHFGSPDRGQATNKKKDSSQKLARYINTAWRERQISIVANSDTHWDTELGEAVNYGNLIHELLAKIITADDVEEVVTQYTYKGMIGSDQRAAIEKTLYDLVTHDQLEPYFGQNNLVLTEKEILTSEGTIVIPDRLIFQGDRVTIIDYKTGQPKQEYHEQLGKYDRALTDLGHTVAQKLLVYISPEIVVEECLF